VALLVGGCGRGDDVRTAPPARAAVRPPRTPALCGRRRAHITGHVSAPAATELSGLVLSRSQPGVLWTHNDSGDRPRVLAVAADGRLLGDVALTGAENVDWEDVAIGRAPASVAGARRRSSATAPAGALFVADIGDNLAQRASVAVYRVAEPRVGGAGAVATAAASRIELRYPDGPRDAEALLVDPSDGALVIVAKSFSGTAGVYVADRPTAAATPATLRRSGRLSLGAGEAVTAGDVSGDGRTIVLRTYDRAFVWARRDGERARRRRARAPSMRRSRRPARRRAGGGAGAEPCGPRVLHGARGRATGNPALRAGRVT
jgi:hypothetical protein